MLNAGLIGCAVVGSVATAYAVQRVILSLIVRALRSSDEGKSGWGSSSQAQFQDLSLAGESLGCIETARRTKVGAQASADQAG